MVQGFVFYTPVKRGALASSVVRRNFNAAGSWNAGASAPSNPQKGMPWLDTSGEPSEYSLKFWDGSAWKVIASWPYEDKFGEVVRFEITVPSAIWSLSHSLDVDNVTVVLFDTNGLKIEPLEIDVSNSNTCVVTHAVPVAGSAIVIG